MHELDFKNSKNHIKIDKIMELFCYLRAGSVDEPAPDEDRRRVKARVGKKDEGS